MADYIWTVFVLLFAIVPFLVFDTVDSIGEMWSSGVRCKAFVIVTATIGVVSAILGTVSTYYNNENITLICQATLSLSVLIYMVVLIGEYYFYNRRYK
jgi:purine-cytosine permease-like protein